MCQVSNRAEHVAAAAAAWRCGAIHAGVDHELTGAELSWLVGHTQPSLLLFEPVRRAVDPLAPLTAVLRDHPRLSVLALDLPSSMPRCSDLAQLLRGDRSDAGIGAPAPAAGDPALILFSSGTTGRPKGAILRHRDCVTAWRAVAGVLGLDPEDVHLGHLPLSHGFGLSMAVAALITGGRLVLMDRFSASRALGLIGNEGITVFNGTPSHFQILLNRRDPHRHDVGTLRIGAGTAASFSPSLLRRIFGELEMDLLLMYGSSEGGGVLTTDRETMLAGSVGVPAPGLITIMGPDGSALPNGEIGEVVFNRRAGPVNYWGAPAAGNPPDSVDLAAAAGQYRSGDLGRIDDRGRLHLLGRLKHQIDRGGLKVDPVEVEDSMLQCTGVADAGVTGVPHPVLGEVVCACVVPHSGANVTLSGLREQLAAQLAPHKLPDQLCHVTAIPRTDMGKVRRDALRGLALDSAREGSDAA